jgi:hypothetical protein
MPIVAALVPAALGLYQTISGAIKQKKAEKAIDNTIAPKYTPNKAINDYYQMALNRANTGAYNSLQYQVGKKQADTAFGAGINALQDRRSAVGNIGALTAGYTNSLQKLGAQAEQTQRQNIAQLGQATNMQLNDSRFAYEQNQVVPYQQQLQLNYAKMGGAANLVNAGLSNIGSGVQTAAIGAMTDPDFWKFK